MLLIKNPAGANEAVRTIVDGGPPKIAVVALNDAIADGRDVSWIWDVDFEPLIAGLDRLVATGERAAELALRFKYGGPGSRLDRGHPRARRCTRPRARADAARAASCSSSPRTPRCSRLRKRERDAASSVRTGSVRHEDRRRSSLSRLPEHLRRPRQHRGAVAARRVARTRARGRAVSVGDRVDPDEHDLLYIGGGQDREQALVAQDLPTRQRRGSGVGRRGAAVLAVCGGYQLLGRSYRDLAGADLPGIGAVPVRHRRRGHAHDRRRPARVRARARRQSDAGRIREPRGTDAASTPALSHSAASLPDSATTARAGWKGCRVGRAVGTYLHGPLLPRNPWFADWLLEQRSPSHRREGTPLSRCPTTSRHWRTPLGTHAKLAAASADPHPHPSGGDQTRHPHGEPSGERPSLEPTAPKVDQRAHSSPR